MLRENPVVAIIMGSQSDWNIMQHAQATLDDLKIPSNAFVMSAHRTPEKVAEFASDARSNGYSILIGAAGMAAHLAGALKAHSTLPVIGIPLPGGMMDGLDSLLATVNMPKGVPVATVSMGKAGAINAAVLCAEIFSLQNADLALKLDKFKENGCML